MRKIHIVLICTFIFLFVYWLKNGDGSINLLTKEKVNLDYQHLPIEVKTHMSNFHILNLKYDQIINLGYKDDDFAFLNLDSIKINMQYNYITGTPFSSPKQAFQTTNRNFIIPSDNV